MKAIYYGQVIAEAVSTHQVDGYHYFPRESVRFEHLEESDFSTQCPSKGTARYWHVKADPHKRLNAALSYPEVLPTMKKIEGWVGFWTGEREDDVSVVP